MRLLIVLLIILLLAYKLWPEQPVESAEDSFIGPQLEPLYKANNFEEDYIEALDAKRKRMDEEADGGR